MHSPRCRGSWTHLFSSSGATLVEVLVAIFAMGIGLLALLTLFPLGALSMAQAIEDSRAGTIAAEATAFSQTAEELVLRTRHFAQESLLTGSIDLDEARRLQEAYDQLALDATDVQLQIEDLQSSLLPWQIQQYTAPLLAQIGAIQQRIHHIRRMFSLVDRTSVRP